MEKPAPFDAPATDLLGEQRAARVQLKLVVLSGRSAGRELLLEAGTYRIGKAPQNDLVLEDPAVSRFHLEAAVLAEGVRLQDLGSTNGSFCNDVRFQEAQAGPGSVLRVGKSELKVMVAHEPVPLLPSERDVFGALRGASLAMRQVFGLLERVSKADAPVLLEGETGTGKELCAQALHAHSGRSGGPFVIVDLAGIQPNLIESELFGHLRGAFTGATADRAGAFERAHRGTVFLDEVGELSPEFQPRLLRALENRHTKRLGANEYRTFDARVLAATHRDLLSDVRDGRFRADLYHRLAVVKVALPPLRARREDIPLLAAHLLEAMGHRGRLGSTTLALLCDYDWPGNVRELRNVIERAVSLGNGGVEVPREILGLPEPREAPAPGDLGFKEAKERMVAAFERDYVASLFERCGQNVARMAREARLDRVSVYRLLKKHGLM